VLWDQPLSTVNQNAYVNQSFGDFPTYSSFLADDFHNIDPWIIEAIYVPGDGWNGFTTLMNATSLTWQIYADNAGVPDGDPSGAGNSPVWSITLPPTDPQVTITPRTPGGMPSNVLLTLATPGMAPPGDWWLVFYPQMDFAFGQYGRQPADTTNGYFGQFVNPGGGFGYGSVWQSWTVLGVTQQDIAFRIEGTIGGTVDVPWLSEDPLAGSLGAGACEMVDVIFDSTLLAAGLYEASLDVSSNDPDEPVINLPVSMLVVEPAIELAKTVGTDSSVCATTDEITVDEGTTVYYCYTVTNTGDVMLDIHNLEDDILGPILIDFPYDLMPGASAFITVSAVIDADVTNIGTWTASAGAFSVEASDTATVNVIIEPDVYWYYLPINFKNYP